MARYTPEFLRALRQRYENTDQVMTSIAAEFEIGVRTLQRMVMTQGWRKRSLRTRGLPIALGLLEEARALGAKQSQPGHPRESGNPVIADGAKSEPPGILGPRFRGDDGCENASAPNTPLATPTPTLPLAGGGSPTAIDRLEALVVKEIEAEEAAQALLIGKHRVVGAAERSARTLATLTQTLRTLHGMRAGNFPHSDLPDQEIHDDDDMPSDIDEFRRELARRIDAFVASRTDIANAGSDSGAAAVDEAG